MVDSACFFIFNTQTCFDWVTASGPPLNQPTASIFVHALFSIFRWSGASVAGSGSLSVLGVRTSESTQPHSGLWQAVSISAHVGRLSYFLRVSTTVVCLILWWNLETEHRGCLNNVSRHVSDWDWSVMDPYPVSAAATTTFPQRYLKFFVNRTIMTLLWHHI